MLGTKHIFSTASHQQTNGQVERFNATFCQQLSKYCSSNHGNWDHYLKYIIYAYNNTKHATTNYTPYEIAFNRHPRFPFDQSQQTFRFSRANDYWLRIATYKKCIQNVIKANIAEQQRLAKIRYDKNRSHPSYTVNELVWLQILGSRSKFDPRYTGSFVIVKVLSPVTYQVLHQNDHYEQIVHVNNLRPVYERVF
ncbi:unnamed protein product [Didymodactylos carnosus]|uniref:Integrase catalytic domain-containing protein n=1 Tax=Didymodactylos carnosus TaxID=1234261 RepID=A0A8S2X4B6_9BILA|nr:unnamed protein product [Didymodactylos carnosus]